MFSRGRIICGVFTYHHLKYIHDKHVILMQVSANDVISLSAQVLKFYSLLAEFLDGITFAIELNVLNKRKIMFCLHIKKLFSVSFMLLFSLSVLRMANAATYTDCSTTISDLVSGATGCAISDQFKEFLNTDPITVNQSGGFFSENDWLFGGKIGKDEGYDGTASGKSGTYNFSSVFDDTWENVMLVFKDGKHTTLVAYLLDTNVDSGTWFSPFGSSGLSSGSKKVSYIGVYYTEGRGATTAVQLSDGVSVPEPSLVALISIGIFGMAIAQRVKKPKVLQNIKID